MRIADTITIASKNINKIHNGEKTQTQEQDVRPTIFNRINNIVDIIDIDKILVI